MKVEEEEEEAEKEKEEEEEKEGEDEKEEEWWLYRHRLGNLPCGAEGLINLRAYHGSKGIHI